MQFQNSSVSTDKIRSFRCLPSKFKLKNLISAQMMLGFGLTLSIPICSVHAEVINKNNLSQSSAQQLPTINVQAQQDKTTILGGQISSQNNLGFLGDKDFMETPFSTIGYTDQYIENQQAKDITEVIAKTDPSVFTNGASGGWSENYYIRGFASSTSDMSMNGMFGITPFYRTSPEMFERVEVLKGPSALLNGMPPAGSVGGVVNLVTKHAGDVPLNRFTATYMSDSQFGGHLDLGRRFGQDKEFGVRFNSVYRDGNGAIRDQDKQTQQFALGLDWRGKNTRISADIYSAEDRVDGVNRGINLASGIDIPKPPKPDTLLNPDWSFVETKDKGAMIRGEYDINDQLMAYASYGQSKTDYKYNGAMSATLLDQHGTLETKMGQLAFDLEKKSADVGFKARFNTGSVDHQWVANATYYEHDQNDYGVRNVAGAEWITNLYDPVWGKPVPFNTPHISKTSSRLSSYGIADTLSFAQERVQLTLGIRQQDVVSESFNIVTGNRTSRYDKSATTPGAAILFKATDYLSLYANYIEGLSQGTTAPYTAVNAGEVFAPFKTKQKELGLKVELGQFSNTLSVFEIEKPSSYTDPVTNIFTADGEQRNRGVEWSFLATPIEHIRLLGGLAYIDPELTKTAGGKNQGNTATGVAKQQAKLGLEWDTPILQGLTLTGNATAVSKQYINQENTLSASGRTLFDLGARYKSELAQLPVTLRASVNNVTNKAYWGMPQLSSLALGAPRTYMLSVSLDF
ncbi:TonB-dependent receptor [Acinetobacter nematophilus]|uniref:TonB-dependent siderophore receptor n=1 Tax=Acinetobacter nematophilus TaxID=2994642 RepID=A0A9X3DV59_9GAMM|nr:TonB-dependent siderophore receptor [Acinetobacter nematophilus]MCX5468958.1 TonB-dependent siderophore receptor [Acinetobacter nematophilus]